MRTGYQHEITRGSTHPVIEWEDITGCRTSVNLRKKKNTITIKSRSHDDTENVQNGSRLCKFALHHNLTRLAKGNANNYASHC